MITGNLNVRSIRTKLRSWGKTRARVALTATITRSVGGYAASVAERAQATRAELQRL
ncbi:hypothetical protein ABT275_42200 [Streptomyces sp. NPDC001185]|uniref:hypothetical protein n=1 Tax=Streptomyces sp. NPDC001185 TaxID=3154380 RepID=UPI0033180A0F